MFQKIFNFFRFKKTLTADEILRYPKPRQYTREQHNIRIADIDPDAVKTVQRIQQMGCRAYIVGGSVRDLLLGRKPKDYDVVTDAHPQELRRMFANSRIVGRRFRLVHIIFKGHKVIEVSTARSLPTNRNVAKNSDDLYLKRDNQFGTFKEDAARRDFTINALIFDIKTETIVDYTGGFEDIQNRIVRVIGNPDISFPEDPVRMYRAVKFAALLGLGLDATTYKSIQKHKALLKRASTARLHEEYNKIFRSGKAAIIFASLNNSGLMDTLMPSIKKGENLETSLSDEAFLLTGLGKRLTIADRMIQEHEEVNLNVYYALLAAGVLAKTIAENRRDHEKQLERKIREPLADIQKDIQLTRREYDTLLQIFSTQNLFRRDVSDRKGWVKEFQQRKIFPESFTVYKILARASEDESALQKALFWEIGLRHHLPETIRKSSVQRSNVDDKEYAYANSEPNTNNRNPNVNSTKNPRKDNYNRRGRKGGRRRGHGKEAFPKKEKTDAPRSDSLDNP